MKNENQVKITYCGKKMNNNSKKVQKKRSARGNSLGGMMEISPYFNKKILFKLKKKIKYKNVKLPYFY